MVIWANMGFLKSPRLHSFQGDPAFEALGVLSRMLRTFVIDQSGALDWPFPTRIMLDQSQPVAAMPVAECLTARATDIWTEAHTPIVVLCGGDIDSLAVLAALLQTAPASNLVSVHYTSASVARYPEMFTAILPALGVPVVEKTSETLLEGITTRYCDGRSGDDFQASYFDMLSNSVPDNLRTGSLAQLIDHLVSQTPGRSERQIAARVGIEHWIASQPFPIETPWQFVLYAYRACFTQTSAWAGILLEEDTVSAFEKRTPFYDSPVFSGATRYLAENFDWPENETIGMKQYVYDFFGDADWYEAPGFIDIHSVIHPGRMASHWLDAEGNARAYSELPLLLSPATWSQIKHWRDAHEVAPIQTSYGWFDANSLSDERIMRAVRNWDHLTTLTPDGKLVWKRADNTFVPLTKEELDQVYTEIDIARTQRSGLLHIKAEQFNQMTPLPTPAQLSDLAFWLNPV